MKRIGVIVFVAMTFMSCSLSKVEKSARKMVDGHWVLDAVTYDSAGVFNTQLFNDASATCFEGSQWFFRSNNSTGTYNILNTDCTTGARNFRWSANEIGKNTNDFDFTMKFIDEKNKDITKNRGFRMQLKYLDGNTMQLMQTIDFEGAPFYINLNFTRTSL